jgi:hypothetical protein
LNGCGGQPHDASLPGCREEIFYAAMDECSFVQYS